MLAVMERDEAVARILAALRRRSDRAWAAHGGRGAQSGYLTITAPPNRLTGGLMDAEDRAMLADLLGLERIGLRGLVIPATERCYRDYLRRAEGEIEESPRL